MSINTVIKSDGTEVPFDPNKVNKWAQYASDNGVPWSDIALKAFRKCYDGCKTSDIQKAMIDACVEMEDQAHLKMAGRILLGSIYKEAHGGFKNIPTLKDFYHDMVQKGLWDDLGYTNEELDELEDVIDHDKNLSESYGYTALKQMRDKYLIQDLINHVCHESPQFMFMGVALQAMVNQPKTTRIEDVKKTYEYLSDLKINLSTPMLVNLRTKNKGLASCCVYTTNDTADSLATGDHIAYMMTCASAGIGSHLTTRSKGDPIRHGSVVHQGKLPYLRMIESAVHANKQACYDAETYILTNTGFKLFRELGDDDLVAQVDDLGEVSFVEPLNRFVYPNVENMVLFDRGNGVGQMVTDNHRMVVVINNSIELKDDGSDVDITEQDLYDFVKASDLELNDKTFFPVTATTINKDSRNLKYWENMLLYAICNVDERFGVYELDGSELHSTLGQLVKLYNAEDNGLDDLELKTIGGNDIAVNDIPVRYLYDKFIGRGLENFGLGTIKEIIDCIEAYSQTIDGNKVIKTYFQKNLLQALTALSGLRVELHDKTHNIGKNLSHDYVSYTIDRSAPSLVCTNEYTKSVVEYNSEVYCVEVPSNRIIVKRRGDIMVCGNSRGGANTSYFSVLDPEIEDLIVLKNPTTVTQKRIRNIDYAVNVNRLFCEKVARNEDWYTISYYHAKELHDAFYSGDYDEFKRMYDKYENSEHAVKYKARELAIKFLTESVETGRVYIHYVDEANRHTPFKDKIYSSNLCVAPETLLLTKHGEIPVYTLENKEVDVWNGKEWSTVTVRKTGEDQELLLIKFSNGVTMRTTPYHKFYRANNKIYNFKTGRIDRYRTIYDEIEVRAGELCAGHYIANFVMPSGDEVDDVYVVSVETANNDSTYCANEPMRNRLFFNGIETGNCSEIELPTKGFTNVMDLYSDEPEGEIGLCSLSSLVQGRISDEEYEDVAYYVTLLVDNTIDLMDYPFPALRRTAQARRSIGIGMTNLAHDLASRGLSYTTQEGKEYIHQVAERHAYWLYRASLRIGQEKGNAEWMYKTEYPEGWTPLSTYNRNVDGVVKADIRFDWDKLSEDIKENGGIRNSTLIAIPPNESSSQLTNTTNSVYPIRSLKVIKTSGTGRNILLAPDYDTLGDKYDIAWDVPSKDLIEMYAIIQKFTDQGISPDLYVSYKDSQLLSSRSLLADFLLMMKLGCKSRYYINSQSGVDVEASKDGVEVIDGDLSCESCVL